MNFRAEKIASPDRHPSLLWPRMQFHVSASECLLELTTLYRELPSMYWTDVVFKGELLHQCEVEKNEEAKSLLRKCVTVLEQPLAENSGDA